MNENTLKPARGRLKQLDVLRSFALLVGDTAWGIPNTHGSVV